MYIPHSMDCELYADNAANVADVADVADVAKLDMPFNAWLATLAGWRDHLPTSRSALIIRS